MPNSNESSLLGPNMRTPVQADRDVHGRSARQDQIVRLTDQPDRREDKQDQGLEKGHSNLLERQLPGLERRRRRVLADEHARSGRLLRRGQVQGLPSENIGPQVEASVSYGEAVGDETQAA